MRHPLLALVLALPASSAHAQEAAKLASEPVPVGTRLLDLDGDGALDLLECRADGGLSVRRNVGPRSFVEVRQELPAVRVSDVLLSDLDGDGRLDLYLVGPEADVALVGLGGGAFREATQELGLGESGHGLSAERRDVDADGLLDLVVHNQGSDVLFWARADGRFEREELTQDGVAPTAATVIAVPLPDSPGVAQGAPQSSSGPGRTLGAPATSGPSSASARVAAPPPPSSSAPLIALSLDARFVNDDQNEVGSADIVDGSLTGADVSTSSGNVTFVGAVVTAPQGVFGLGSTSGPLATVSGGNLNVASGIESTVSGGNSNGAAGVRSTVAGGMFNTALGTYSAVSGGRANVASGIESTVSGGYGNWAAGDYSFAAGRNGKANHQGSFVWGDSVNFVDKNSSATDQFNVYAEGGARVFAVGQTTPSLVVDPSGRVGIGTASPAQPLDVLGNMQVDGSTLFVDSTNNRVGIGTASPAQPLDVVGNVQVDGSTLFVDSTNNRVGIGTASPAQPLDVVGNVQVDGSTLFVDSTNNRVGIGTTTPASRLDARSAVAISNILPGALDAGSTLNVIGRDALLEVVGEQVGVTSAAFGLKELDASGAHVSTWGLVRNTSAGGALNFTNGTNVSAGANPTLMTLTTAGRLGIGTTTPGFTLEVNGSAHRVDNSSTWTVTSDERLKKNIHDLEGALETLLALRGVTFEYRDPTLGAGLRRGFLAQEIEEVLPEWVEDGEDGYKRLTVCGFEALAVEALRELRDSQDAEVAELREELASLRASSEARVARMEALETELQGMKTTLALLLEVR